ncbi:glycosyltransferase [Meiothermus hypogaeus]|uniref:Glycosyl transferase n=2 Tax=Meiothermus hypogaeus TaxID=884155 RepID=A0A511R568_9DEIN|nr:glycosyltransferase [Meiothermus hypogaeus]RIH75248.1 putative glycosyltransferase EpsF [Meiothermus hypogaeus]GEM84437.1 glycosyl transferase [Meiothermus hypogaeus NBRC 106114]
MKILHVINSLELAGAETLLTDLALRLSQQNIDVEIYALKASGSLLEEKVKRSGVRLYFSPISSVYSPLQIPMLVKHLFRHKYDLIHVHLFPAQLWAACAASFAHIPMITTEHSTYNRRRTVFFRMLDRWMYKRYRAVVTISKATAVALSNWLPEIAKRICTIFNGIEVSYFANAQSVDIKALPSLQRPLLVSVGRLEQEKDQVTLLKSLPYLETAHLLLIGDGPMRGQLQELASQLGVTHRVHFLGRRVDVPNLLKIADVYIQPSRWEGFGIATLEAMAAGVPVVVSRVAGLKDVVGDAGLLFEPGNERELAEKITALLTSQEACRQYAARGQVRAMQFDIKQTVEQYKDLYLQIIGKKTMKLNTSFLEKPDRVDRY